MKRLDDAVLEQTVQGYNLPADTLRQTLGQDATLLVFLRHFGCIFCRETVADLRRCQHDDPQYPRVLFVYQGSLSDGAAFFASLWPEAQAIADPEKQLYQAFGITQGAWAQMFGAPVWACGWRAARKGHSIGAPVGDPWTMPGLFLLQGDRLYWQHSFAHAGDHPDFAQLPQYLPQYLTAHPTGNVTPT